MPRLQGEVDRLGYELEQERKAHRRLKKTSEAERSALDQENKAGGKNRCSSAGCVCLLLATAATESFPPRKGGPKGPAASCPGAAR